MALVGAQDQAHRRVLVVKRPVLLRVVAIQVHLAHVGMGQGTELQVDDDEAAQAPMEEQQIDPIPSLVDAQPPLSSNKREALAKFEQEVLQPMDQGLFKIGLRILVLEVQEFQHIRVFDRIVGRDGIFWLRRRALDQHRGLVLGQRSALVELAVDLPVELAHAPAAAQGFGFGSPNTMNVMAEAMRTAFADRAVWMGDEDFVPVPKTGLLNLTTQRALADRFQPLAEEHEAALGARPVDILAAERVFVAEVMLVEHGDEAVEFHEGVLQRRCRQQNLEEWSRGVKEMSFGEDLKNKLTSPGGWTIGITGFGECLPYQENRVTLNNDKKDIYGLPTLNIDADWKANEIAMRKDMIESAAEMLEAAGFKEITTFDNPDNMGLGIHEMGTARMGNDPKTSVLNKWNQVHEAPNVFVTDGAAMTSSGCQNPSLTYMALTARAADHAVGELKKGNL